MNTDPTIRYHGLFLGNSFILDAPAENFFSRQIHPTSKVDRIRYRRNRSRSPGLQATLKTVISIAVIT